jgi:hypothetical protein
MNETTAPRRMLQPAKSQLRDALRNAADRIEAISRERDAWRDLAEREPEEATPFPALFLLVVGFIAGAACMAVAGWAL